MLLLLLMCKERRGCGLTGMSGVVVTCGCFVVLSLWDDLRFRPGCEILGPKIHETKVLLYEI